MLRLELALCALDKEKYVRVGNTLYLAWSQDTDWVMSLLNNKVYAQWEHTKVALHPRDWVPALRYKLQTLVCPD